MYKTIEVCLLKKATKKCNRQAAAAILLALFVFLYIGRGD
jgi:hypothetical protein